MNGLFKTTLAIAIVLACSIYAMGVNAKTLTLGIDFSGSNSLLRHANFAHAASQYVEKEITALKNGDVVTIKTFGSRADVANLLSASFTITRKTTPQKIAAAVSQYLQSLPQRDGIEQSSTDLLAWLEFTSGFACDEGSQVIAITDAVESSSVVQGGQFLRGQQSLPEPGVDLTGCEVTFWGLGAGLPHANVRFVRDEWGAWMDKAGASFTAVIP